MREPDDFLRREALRNEAVRDATRPLNNRPFNIHQNVVWANYGDAFTSRAEFDSMVQKKLAKENR